MEQDYEMNYSVDAIAKLTREELIWKSAAMDRNYQQGNKPKPEDVAGTPMWLEIHGDRRYCLHYPSKHRKNGPVVFDIHGGGFVWGSPEEDDLFSARLNEVLDVEVFSLEYPRTAAHPYPEALNELFDTIRYMSEHAAEYNFDPAQIVIGGHSAGGNLTAALTLRNNREKAFAIKCQYLAYPAVDMEMRGLTDQDYAEDGLGLSKELLTFFNRVYAPEKEMEEVYCAPIRATREQMIGLPDAVVMTCERDCLRYQGREYARKLIEANVAVLAKEFEGCAHAFEVFPGPRMVDGQDFLIRGIRYYLGL